MEYKDIFDAINANDIEAVKTLLLEYINNTDRDGYTALVKAILIAKNKPLFDLLLESGPTPYTGGSLNSVFYYLWINGWPDKIQKVVDHGLDLNLPGIIERSEHAIITDVCRSLRGSFPDNIFLNSNLIFLKELLRCGARTDIPDENGKLPLDYLPDKVRTEVETYIVNLETERQGNIASEAEFY